MLDYLDSAIRRRRPNGGSGSGSLLDLLRSLSSREQDLLIVTSVLGSVCLLLLVLVAVLFKQLSSVKRQLRQTPSIKVQKLTMDDKNHAFQNPTIAPDEELSRRGYSMYVSEDVERGVERQTGGQFVEELSRELDQRQQRQSQSTAPPFLLQSIQENKRKSHLANPAAQPRQSETNPNFIY